MTKCIELTAPSHWACYLINGDASDLEVEDIIACDAWIDSEDVGLRVDCQDAGFRWRHDASEFALGSDCQTYTFELGG